jgi:ZIP family zinc transporter/zinc and cadmium transporter
LSAFVLSIVFALVAAAATMIGGAAVVLPGDVGHRRLSHGIAFGAGFMLSAAFVSMVPESFEYSAHAPYWILLGYVLAHLFEHAFTSHFHFGEETHTEHALQPGVSTSALVGLILHALFDGVAISSGFLITPSLGIFIALAVILHKIPEGVTIASVTVAAGRGNRQAMVATGLLSVATLLGALVMSMLEPYRGPALALSCGIAVYVAATDLMPELNKQRERLFSMSALAGVLSYFLVHWLMKLTGLH